MHLVGSSGAGKYWTYSSTDAVATIQAANYFLTMYADLVPGDFIHVRAVVGGTEAHFDASVLLSNSTTVTLLKSVSYT
jgi:hypothetical protein